MNTAPMSPEPTPDSSGQGGYDQLSSEASSYRPDSYEKLGSEASGYGQRGGYAPPDYDPGGYDRGGYGQRGYYPGYDQRGYQPGYGPQQGGPPGGGRPSVDPWRMWSGGLATAVVAALIALVGVLISRWLLMIPLLAPHRYGAYGSAHTTGLMLGAAAAALVATALAHLLMLGTPRPLSFLGWIVALATAVAVVIPFSTAAPLNAKIATAIVFLVLGIAIGSLVSGVAARSVRGGPPGQYPGQYPPGGQYGQGQYPPGQYGQGQYRQGQYPQGHYQQGPYQRSHYDTEQTDNQSRYR